MVALTLLLGAASACGGATSSGTPGGRSSPSPTPAAATASAEPTLAPAQPRARVDVPVAGMPPAAGHPWYLAIGDSITSGFTVDSGRAGVNSSWALQLQPLLAGRGQDWTLYDTACPSERTDTYFTLCPGRRAIPFLASQSQHDAAMAAIRGHRDNLRLVLLDLGSNDLIRALAVGTDAVTAAGQLRANLTRIITEVRAAAPGVPIVLANFYNPLATFQPATQGQVLLVNDLIRAEALDEHVILADFFSAINSVTSGSDPTLCRYVDCAHLDIHPTVLGHARLAAAALAVIPTS